MPPHTPSRTPPSRLRPGKEKYHQSASVLHPSAPLIINCAKIVFATPSLTPITTPLPNLVKNSWWKQKKCRLTLLQEHPLHAFAQDKKKYHQSASVLHPSAPSNINCVKIGFAPISLTPIQTPLPNLVNNSWWKRKICRRTLLQQRPLFAFAQDKKKYHQSASVLHPSAPLKINCVNIVFATISLTPIPTPLPNLVNNS